MIHDVSLREQLHGEENDEDANRPKHENGNDFHLGKLFHQAKGHHYKGKSDHISPTICENILCVILVICKLDQTDSYLAENNEVKRRAADPYEQSYQREYVDRC